MSKFVMIMSQKGGVGKTFTCRLLTQVWEESGKEFVLIDADHRVKATAETFPDKAIAFNLTDQDERIRLLDMATAQSEKDFIVDFPGGSIDEIVNLINGSSAKGLFFEALRNAGFEIVMVAPFTKRLSSIMKLKDLEAAFGDQVAFFFVKNMMGITLKNASDEQAKYNTTFGSFEWTIKDVEKNPVLKDFNPREFAIEKMGLNETDLDDKGTTPNCIRLPEMPDLLDAWVDDYTPFSDASFKAFPFLQSATAREYFNDIKGRILKTDLFKSEE